MIWLLTHWKQAAVVVALALAWYSGWAWRDRAADRDEATAVAQYATQVAKASEKARQSEQAKQSAVDRLASEYERGRADAEAVAGRVADDLAAGNVRLRSLWQSCAATSRVSGDSQAASLADALAQLREASAGRIVGAAAEADAQVKGLQDYAREVSK